jgi:hypothetical protein
MSLPELRAIILATPTSKSRSVRSDRPEIFPGFEHVLVRFGQIFQEGSGD